MPAPRDWIRLTGRLVLETENRAAEASQNMLVETIRETSAEHSGHVPAAVYNQQLHILLCDSAAFHQLSVRLIRLESVVSTIK